MRELIPTSSNTITTATSSLLALLLLSSWLNNHGVQAGWIDIDTEPEHMTTTSFVDGSTYTLVMSDEFNVPNREFGDGSDPLWTALDKSDDDANDVGGGSLHFYNSSTVSTTNDGMMEINSRIQNTEWEHYDHIKKKYRTVTKNFVSGMVQSWNKFCFTGGIVEIDVIFPGEHNIGGLWPAAWMLGNMGRATYEATTNNIWPWSYDTCDRERQQAQTISACNTQNHYGLAPHKGRGATEIDILEVMTGTGGDLPHTDPPIAFPYVDLTLQVAPGITKNRPMEGYQPVRKTKISPTTGHVQAVADNWYDIDLYGNTSLNPFFYGTYLAETKPTEPVQRSKEQAFQADAVGAMHQVTPSHFNTTHSFRIEWQPGPGGRIDWFVKAYKANNTMEESIEGDGRGSDWVKALSITDEALKKAMGSQIPIEPSYLIFNTAISTTWGFPYKIPSWCKPCYDCADPNCWCNFNPGFCQMMQRNVSYYIDFVRVYQSHNSSAHVGMNHTLGCDPEEYPTKEWIKGHAHLYSRPPPFGYSDFGPLKKIQNGGGSCQTDADCGGVLPDDDDDITTTPTRRLKSDDDSSGGAGDDSINADDDNNNSNGADSGTSGASSAFSHVDFNSSDFDFNATDDDYHESAKPSYVTGRGECIPGSDFHGMFQKEPIVGNVCKCHAGFTGPHCLSIDHKDDFPGAYELNKKTFSGAATPYIPKFLSVVVLTLVAMILVVMVISVNQKVHGRGGYGAMGGNGYKSNGGTGGGGIRRPVFQASNWNDLMITGRSV